jgi:phosphoglycolate phosphatase
VAQLLVFDLDGTLVDSSRDIAASLNAALRRFAPDAAELPLERIIAFVGEGARLLVERALAHTGLPLDPERTLSAYLEEYERRLLDTTRLYDGLEEALEAAAAGGATLAVLSNKPGHLSRAVLQGLGVAARFARVLGAGDVPRKPDPAGLLSLLGELRAEPGRAWMVGDSATDVRTARAAAVRAAGVTWGFHPQALIAAGPDRLLERPGELAALSAL